MQPGQDFRLRRDAITADFSAGATSGVLTVHGTNVCGMGAPSAAFAVTVSATPATPTASAATNIGATTFSANWSASSGAESYFLDVATDPGFTQFVAGNNNRTVGNVVTAAVSGLATGTTHYYRVRATSGCGTSGNSNTTTLTLATGTTAMVTLNAAASSRRDQPCSDNLRISASRGPPAPPRSTPRKRLVSHVLPWSTAPGTAGCS
jgi:hypothetical protein